MLNYIEYLNMPTKVTMILVGIFLCFQIVGELMEFKGKAVPELMKIRKYFSRKKKERETMEEIQKTIEETKNIIFEFNSHYSADNICMRDEWIKNVNQRLEENDKGLKQLGEKIDKNNKDTLDILIDNKRNTIINFASRVIDENNPVTREEFTRIFKLYEEYEKIIEENGLKNGEISTNYQIIQNAYEKRMKNHSFIEDKHGYNHTV